MIRTELEYCILGVVWRRGACSAYDIRSEFAASPSAFWSASAGSIYPVVSRLLAAGLLHGKAEPTGRRARQRLSVSAAGAAALRHWLEQVRPETTSATYDPVRTRVHFLEALPARRRRAVIAAAVEGTRARLAELAAREARERESGEMSEALAMMGARYELEARLAWLRDIAPQIGG